MKNLRLLALTLTAATALSLSACNSGTQAGDVNVERAGPKKGPAAPEDGNPTGDSATAGMRRLPKTAVTGKEQFEKADQTVDRNHDGLAD